MLHRAQGLIDVGKVRKTALVFVGLGSLGSHVVANLVFPWREVHLIDPEKLAKQNVERHVLGLDAAGKYKVDGMFNWLVNHGMDPDTIRPYRGATESVLGKVRPPCIVVVTTGSGIAEDSVGLHIMSPTVYGGVYPQGNGGEVITLPNPRQVCLQCVKQTLGRDNATQTNYGFGDAQQAIAGTNLNAVPGLRFMVSLIAAHCAASVLKLIEGGDVPAQIRIVGGQTWAPVMTVPEGEDLSALSAFIGRQKAMSMVQHLKLGRVGGDIKLKHRNSVMTFRLSRGENCPFHSDQNIRPEEV